jgi:hypothetical protein
MKVEISGPLPMHNGKNVQARCVHVAVPELLRHTHTPCVHVHTLLIVFTF